MSDGGSKELRRTRKRRRVQEDDEEEVPEEGWHARGHTPRGIGVNAGASTILNVLTDITSRNLRGDRSMEVEEVSMRNHHHPTKVDRFASATMVFFFLRWSSIPRNT